MNISIAGTGYVGLVTGVCLAEDVYKRQLLLHTVSTLQTAPVVSSFPVRLH